MKGHSEGEKGLLRFSTRKLEKQAKKFTFTSMHFVPSTKLGALHMTSHSALTIISSVSWVLFIHEGPDAGHSETGLLIEAPCPLLYRVS